MDSQLLISDAYVDTVFPRERLDALKRSPFTPSFCCFDPMLLQQAEDLAFELDFNQMNYFVADSNEDSFASGSDNDDVSSVGVDEQTRNDALKQEFIVDSSSQQNEARGLRASANSNINFNNFNVSVNLFNGLPQLDNALSQAEHKANSSQSMPSNISPQFSGFSLPNLNLADLLNFPFYDNNLHVNNTQSADFTHNIRTILQNQQQQQQQPFSYEQNFVQSSSQLNNQSFVNNQENLYEEASVYSSSNLSSNTSISTTNSPRKRQREIKSPKTSQSQLSPAKPQSKKAKKQALAKSTPEFMIKAIENARGTGEFTSSELAITLFYAHKYFMDSNAYSKVRSCLNFTRSRASIRRKIEKMVAQETGVTGGLLLTDSMRHKCKDILKSKLDKLIEEMVGSNDESDQHFAQSMLAHQSSDIES